MVKPNSAEPVVANAALLSTVEIGLGSALHAWNVPLAGHLLSLNQGFILCRALLATGLKSLPSEVSNVAAALKSLSPAGKKLTPMLALSVQGVGFSVGPWLFGINSIGLSVGMVLLSLWGFIQPLALAYLLFGQGPFQAAWRILETLEKSLGLPVTVAVAVFVVAAKALAGIAVVVAAYRLPETAVSRYVNRMTEIGKQKRPSAPTTGHPAWLALRDLLNPLFLISLALTTVFFLWADSPRSTVVWGLLRPVALGFLLFLGFRILPLEKLFPGHSAVHKTLLALRQM